MSKSFTSGVDGEWSDATESMMPSCARGLSIVDKLPVSWSYFHKGDCSAFTHSSTQFGNTVNIRAVC